MAAHALRQSDSAAEGPPVSRRRSRKRQAIIEAAKAVFFEDGYAGASMERITARAGVSKATIYAHFASKEEILREVVDAVVAPIASHYVTTATQPEDFEDGLRKLARMIARNAVLPDVIALERLVIAEALRFPELGALYLRNAVLPALMLFCPRFEAAMDSGRLRRDDPMKAVLHFAEWCTGSLRRDVLFNQRACPDEAETDAHADDALNAFLRGYAAPC